MTIPMIGSAVAVILMVPAVVFRLRLTRTAVRRFDAFAYSINAIFGIMEISTVISCAIIIYLGWKAGATAMPGTSISDAVDVLFSQIRSPIIWATISLVCWYTGIPYRTLRSGDLANGIGSDALEKASAAWRSAMLFCCIVHVVSAFGYILIIHFLRAIVT